MLMLRKHENGVYRKLSKRLQALKTSAEETFTCQNKICEGQSGGVLRILVERHLVGHIEMLTLFGERREGSRPI